MLFLRRTVNKYVEQWFMLALGSFVQMHAMAWPNQPKPWIATNKSVPTPRDGA